MNESDTNSNFISYLLRLINIKKDLLIVHPILMVKLFQWNRIPEQKHFQNGTVEKGVYRSLFSYCPLQTGERKWENRWNGRRHITLFSGMRDGDWFVNWDLGERIASKYMQQFEHHVLTDGLKIKKKKKYTRTNYISDQHSWVFSFPSLLLKLMRIIFWYLRHHS